MRTFLPPCWHRMWIELEQRVAAMAEALMRIAAKCLRGPDRSAT
jgi:hypothetical protein